MNWFVAESVIADHRRELDAAEGLRWPEVARARRMAAMRGPREQSPLRAVPRSRVAVPTRRLARLFHGLATGRPVAQR